MDAALAIIFLGIAGFNGWAAACSGGKNVHHKSMINWCAGGIMFYLFGMAMINGTGSFVGGASGWVGNDVGDGSAWMVSFFILMVSTSIVLGSMAGRMSNMTTVVFLFVYQFVVYSFTTHWCGANGWLTTNGFRGGSAGCLHMAAGFAALAGNMFFGERSSKGEGEFSSCSFYLMWLGMYALNGEMYNTTLAACAGGFFTCVLARLGFGGHSSRDIAAGAIGGMVSVSMGAGDYYGWSAIAMAALSVVFSHFVGGFISKMVDADDASGAFNMHGMCGMWGAIGGGILNNADGWFYSNGFGASVGWQIIGCAAIAAWTFVIIYGVMFGARMAGLTESDEDDNE